MDDLIQQECLIESQLKTYQSQLSLVEQQLEVSDTDFSDLQQLKKDLSELIELVKDNLLEVKKQKLLLALEAPSGSGAIAGEDAAEAQRTSNENATTSSVSGTPENTAEEEENGLQGMQCQAPLTEAWGAVNYHNAVIVCRELDMDSNTVRLTTSEGENGDCFKVRVLFTHPTYNAMKPCSFFLEGKCKFSDETCKFSHGHVVQFTELQPYQGPDFSLVHVGGKCLAKHTDGLWHPAIISSFGELFTVHFTALNSTTQLEPDSVLPLESSDESSSSDSSDSDSGEERDDSEGVSVVEWRPKGPQQALGEWEKHTTGIGSRLMAKMGYVVGKGLGKDDQGCVEPVEIVILPSGKSLDVCAELREAKKLRKPVGQVTKRRRRNRPTKKLAEVLKEQQWVEKSNVFDFLNTKIFRKDHHTTESPSSESFTLQKEENACSKRAGNSSENLNVKLFKAQEEIKSVKKRRQSLQQSLLRHKERKDKVLVAQVQEKLAANERLLARLQREEQTIQRSITTKTERKKLSVF